MRIAALQLAIRNESKAQAIERVLAAIDKAAGNDLIMLPELWPCGYFSFDRYSADSEGMDGPLIRALAQKAAQVRAHVFAGSFVERSGEDLYNASVLLSPDGKVIAKYRKIHLFGFQSEERRLLKAGNEVVVADTPWGKAGISTCYDLRFPELYRAMVDQGAEFFLVAAAWPRERMEAWTLFCRSRAHENLAYLFSSNCAGISGKTALAGHSLFVDPGGNVVAEGGEVEQILTADVDMSAVARTRKEFSVLEDRVSRFQPKSY